MLSHLGSEHMSDAVHRALQHQASHQEAEEHHVREERAEVHHLKEGENVNHITHCCHGHAFLRPHT